MRSSASVPVNRLVRPADFEKPAGRRGVLDEQFGLGHPRRASPVGGAPGAALNAEMAGRRARQPADGADYGATPQISK